MVYKASFVYHFVKSLNFIYWRKKNNIRSPKSELHMFMYFNKK